MEAPPSHTMLIYRDLGGNVAPRDVAVAVDDTTGIEGALVRSAALVRAPIPLRELCSLVTATATASAALDDDTRNMVLNVVAALATFPVDERDAYLDELKDKAGS